jgi:hypothetical protein
MVAIFVFILLSVILVRMYTERWLTTVIGQDGFADFSWIYKWMFSDWFLYTLILTLIIAFPVYVVYATVFGKPGS